MKIYILAALGCIFWLLPLAMATFLFRRFGFYEDGFGFNYDAVPLLLIPMLMIALTLALAAFARKRHLPGIAIMGASALSFAAGFFWLAIWGQGV